MTRGEDQEALNQRGQVWPHMIRLWGTIGPNSPRRVGNQELNPDQSPCQRFKQPQGPSSRQNCRNNEDQDFHAFEDGG